jgi:hypothetical protein
MRRSDHSEVTRKIAQKRVTGVDAVVVVQEQQRIAPATFVNLNTEALDIDRPSHQLHD